jgi:hypothetical protein
MIDASGNPGGPSAPQESPPPRTGEDAPDRDEAPSGETLEEKTRRDRDAGDVADDIADFA